MTKIVVTGAAGFIGMHVAERLLRSGATVIGIDSLNDYYDVSLKEARVARLEAHPNFTLLRGDVANRDWCHEALRSQGAPYVVHLAAQAGVRYSLQNPGAYIDSNLVGFGNVLEACRHMGVEHLIYASSSSVYGANTKVPFAVGDPIDHPVSLYAATKRANELMAHTYAHLFRLPVTGLRFFTVYGPWGRPDMAYYSFTKRILRGEPIELFNGGNLERDFTYIDDIVDSIVALIPLKPEGTGEAPARILNIGASSPVTVTDFLSILESVLGTRANVVMMPMQPGDVPRTFADVLPLENLVGFRPRVTLADGLEQFARWFRSYHAQIADSQ